MAQTMKARNAVSAKMASCYVTIDGNRYNVMNAKNIEVTFDRSKMEFGILGRMNKGHKGGSSSITGSGEFYFNTSIWREIAYRYQETGEDVYFDMQISNEDITASDIGKQTVILYDCNLDSITLAAFDADSDDPLTESLEFTAERFELPDKYNLMPGMI